MFSAFVLFQIFVLPIFFRFVSVYSQEKGSRVFILRFGHFRRYPSFVGLFGYGSLHGDRDF